MALFGAVLPISSALVQVAVFLSTALLAAYKFKGPVYVFNWEATALKERSSV